jgi:succinate dehydrogenase / fumarate reductase, cytochrome b subunit
MTMADPLRAERPLSPHLQIYRPTLSMTMSILNRITGAALFFGVALFVWWLVAASSSDTQYDAAQAFFGHWFGRLVLFGFTWALVLHTLGGIRHFIWDMGYGFSLPAVEFLARATLIGSIVLTVLLWVIGYGVMS